MPASLTLVTAAILLWNTVYIERAIDASARNSHVLDAKLLKYLSPLGWEHINLTGDYQWRGKRLAQGGFRPLAFPTRLSVLYCPFSDGTPSSLSPKGDESVP